MTTKLEHKFPPLSRFHQNESPPPDSQDKYEVLIVGAGPAGAFLNLLLARFGITSRLCIDSAPGPVTAGHADGLMPRTLEVFQSLGIADEFLNHAKKNYDAAAWTSSDGKGISRSAEPGRPPRQFWATCRFDWFVATLHQGWVLKVLEDDLDKYSPGNGVRYGTVLRSVVVDESKDAEYPVFAEIECQGKTRSVRAKYLVGADGAHSVVRKCLGIKMLGDSTDDMYGVVDMVCDTNFPDVRKIVTIADETGTMLMIPRERRNSGDWLTRFYVPFSHIASTEVGEVSVSSQVDAVKREEAEAGKAGITMETTIKRIPEMMKPYRFKKKDETEVEWFTSYVVGQRLAERIAVKDAKGDYRAFLIGDACHTHSPKEGQGMNVSMADALDLSWKLSHVLHGLSSNPQALLETFAIERYANASLLIDMDKKWYAEKYMKHLQTRAGTSPPAGIVSIEIWNFVLGLTIEYDEGYLVERRGEAVVKGTNYTAGNLREGRRVADTVLVRYADANLVHMQDVLAIDGKYHIVMFASRSFRGENSVLWTAMERVRTEFAPRYPRGSSQGLIVLPEVEDNVDWSIFPEVVRERIEMEVLCASDGTYAFYGVDPEEGAIVIVRPDQFVGTIVGPGDVEKVLAYFDRVLVQV